jgi:hypothetical protein
MDDGTTVLVLVGVGVALIVLLALIGIAFGVFACGVLGAGILFSYASQQGFVGLAVYFACWFFMFPVMLIASVITGMIAASPDRHRPVPIQRLSPEQRARIWDEEDRRYEEALQRRLESARLRGDQS